METVASAFAPATVANLGPGFDVLGAAVEGPGDEVTARRVEASGVRISEITGDGGRLSSDPHQNTAGIAALETLARTGMKVGIELQIRKGLPIGSGLGSSAASAAAAAMAVNLLLGSPLRKSELIAPCLAAEAAVSGKHADNLVPALLGGWILVRSVEPLDLVRLPVPSGLFFSVVTPDFELETRKARAALPYAIDRKDHVFEAGQLAGLIAACFSDDVGLLGRSLVDRTVTPARLSLIPGAAEVIAAALSAGAVGSSISGAGPSIFALSISRSVSQRVGEVMQAAFRGVGLDSTLRISAADAPGARRS